jgi:hypothetical protein
MRCAKNLINSITPPMNAKINPQTFSVLGVTGFSGVSSLWEILNGNCDAMRIKIHHSLKSTLCSCVSRLKKPWKSLCDGKPLALALHALPAGNLLFARRIERVVNLDLTLSLVMADDHTIWRDT